jgi:hypothetical protein
VAAAPREAGKSPEKEIDKAVANGRLEAPQRNRPEERWFFPRARSGRSKGKRDAIEADKGGA